MTTNQDIAHTEIREFSADYAEIKTALESGLIDPIICDEAVSKLDEAAKTLIDTVQTAIEENPTTLMDTIIKARGTFARSFMKLFRDYGLEEELDELLPEEEPDINYGLYIHSL